MNTDTPQKDFPEYYEGRRACRAARSVTEASTRNPYKIGTAARLRWNLGWSDEVLTVEKVPGL